MTTLLGPRTGFSLGESLLSPEAIAEFAADNGYGAVAIADLNNVSAMIRFTKACAKHNVKPIIGATLAIFDDALDKTPPKKRTVENNHFHLKVYVRNDVGIKSLYRLISLASSPDHFYYVPRLPLDEVLLELSKGGLVASSGDFYGVFSHPLGGGIWRSVEAATAPHSAFLELCAIDTPLFATMNARVLDAHAKFGTPLIVTRPMLYSDQERMADTLDVSKTIIGNGKLADFWRSVQYKRDLTLLTPDTLRAHMATARDITAKIYPHDAQLWDTALNNVDRLAQDCGYVWQKQALTLPQVSKSGDERFELIKMIASGWDRRLRTAQFGYQPVDLSPYKRRLKHELSTLINMGFERYFLLVQDLVAWAKDNNIYVGPGRGSVGGSLIAYLIGITDIDPLRFNLIFERFINPDRLDLPDIDLDFMTSGRQRCVDYLVDRYGADCVAGIMNYSTLASAGALRDAARVYGLPVHEYDCTKLVPKVHGTPHTLEQAAEEVPEIDKFRLSHAEVWLHGSRLQGSMRAFGTHAAGICVAGEPLVNRAPVIARTGIPVVAFDKREVEDVGLVKVDLLGLSTLDIHRIAVQLIISNHKLEIILNTIPLDDPRTLEAFAQGRTKGIFQMDGGAATSIVTDMAIAGQLTFEDIVIANALNRPGPLDSGMHTEYIRVKQGAAGIRRRHPVVDSVLRETNGVIVFQETIMRLAVDACGMKMAEADALRKVVSKKQKDKMPEQKQRFVNGLKAGWVVVEMEDGSERRFHRLEKLRVKENDQEWVIEDVIAKNYTLVNV